jgi:uncharacterized protein (TIGR03083 family)
MSKPHGSKEFWLAGLRAESAAFRAAVGQDGALTAPVPSCPGWTVRDLVAHLGRVYGFVGRTAGRGDTSAPERVESDELPAGTDPLAWWDERRAALL